MKSFRIIIIIAAVAVTVLRGVLFLTRSYIDEGPVITCEQEVFELTCDQDENDLLQYVTAYDAQDGEITDIFIEKLFYLYNTNHAAITFVAIDSNNNIAKCQREVIYTDYRAPRIQMKSSGIFTADAEVKLIDIFTAHDSFSGDISSRVKLIGDSYYEKVAGVYPMKARVCNLYGDATEISFNIYLTSKPYSDIIELKEYVLYVDKDQAKPEFKDYIKYASVTLNNVKIDDSELDMTTPGCYEVYYRIGAKGSETGFNRLIVVVGEAL